MQLDSFLKSKIRWHLGYNQTSIPAGDLARLEEAVENIQDSFWYSKISEQVTSCDEAEKRTDMTGGMNNNVTPAGRKENIAGDVDRTISTTDYRDTLKTWNTIYMYECDRLAQHLYVPIIEILNKQDIVLKEKAQNLYKLFLVQLMWQ